MLFITAPLVMFAIIWLSFKSIDPLAHRTSDDQIAQNSTSSILQSHTVSIKGSSQAIDRKVEQMMKNGRYDLALKTLKHSPYGDPEIRWHVFLVSLPYGLLALEDHNAAIEAVDFIMMNLKARGDSTKDFENSQSYPTDAFFMAAFYKSVAYAKLGELHAAKEHFHRFTLGFSEKGVDQDMRLQSDTILKKWQSLDIEDILLTPII